MSIRKIVRFPDPRLRQQTHRVEAIDDAVRRLVDDMAETMYAWKGAGLAAIQVGAPERLFLIDPEIAGKGPSSSPLVFINPEIEWLSPETETGDEGCLSFPSIFIPVKRSLRARVRALDISGEPFAIEGSELMARALQHEHDHLQNKLLYDYAGPIKRQMMKRKLEKMTDEEAEDLVMRHGE